MKAHCASDSFCKYYMSLKAISARVIFKSQDRRSNYGSNMNCSFSWFCQLKYLFWKVRNDGNMFLTEGDRIW